MDSSEFCSKNQNSLDQAFTKNRFKGKVVVVTGGASGIGFGIVERFSNDGATVAFVDINEERGRSAEEYLKAEGYNSAKYYYANVEEKDTCIKAAASIAKDNAGVIDCLINSAVYFGMKGLESTVPDWSKTLAVNVIGATIMVQACHPYMVKAGGGAIVNISSISALRAQADRWSYSASKGAIITVTKNMALDLSKDNIRVNSVAPGWIWSPQQAKASVDGTLESMMPTIRDFTILKRCGNISEVAAVAVFLCSRDATYVTGTNVMVDGGYCAIGPERHGGHSLIVT